MKIKIMHYMGLIACLGIIASCFMPWVHYNNINETFTGFHVRKFVTGNYYGRAGIIITIFSAVVFMLMLTPKVWAKRINLFLSALLFAYCLRTYIIFTSALFEGELKKLPGIYLIVVLSILILVSSVFPKSTGLSPQSNIAR